MDGNIKLVLHVFRVAGKHETDHGGLRAQKEIDTSISILGFIYWQIPLLHDHTQGLSLLRSLLHDHTQGLSILNIPWWESLMCLCLMHMRSYGFTMSRQNDCNQDPETTCLNFTNTARTCSVRCFHSVYGFAWTSAWVGEYTIVTTNVIFDGRGERGRMKLLGYSCPFSYGLGFVQCFCVGVLTL